MVSGYSSNSCSNRGNCCRAGLELCFMAASSDVMTAVGKLSREGHARVAPRFDKKQIYIKF